MLRPIRRALLSVSDKAGLVDFARELHTTFGIELIATGGTRQTLADAGLPVKDISAVTQFPEILDGRVKTLHPAIYAGLLARRDRPDHLQTLADYGLPEIDLVVCNLYPFEQTIAQPAVTEAEALEKIDIGGPCMVRAAAKNYASVTIITDPADYQPLLQQMREYQGAVPLDWRRQLARKAFARICRYDTAIADYFDRLVAAQMETPTDSWGVATLRLEWEKRQNLRYGENPHQKAAFYVEPGLSRPCIATAEQLHGKELSYNNILDLDSALNLVREFVLPACVIVKHNNPCGAATATKLAEAFQRAWDGDPLAAFGGIIAFNTPVDAETAQAIIDPQAKRFVECIIAPDYDVPALEALRQWKENVRLLKTGAFTGPPEGWDYRRVDGGLLVQTRDVKADHPETWKCVTQRAPTDAEQRALLFAWLVCKHVKSNAIVLAQDTQVVGVGAGQMSRVMAVEIAVKKAGRRAAGSVLASDAFFPFPDNVEVAAAAGVTAIIQPGGSVKDHDSINACDRHGIAMLFTATRHFRH
ncbi:MAG: bifunctional phosphoribosylaminoimidazolecarboxamide formyltransferase/IMP cyclohydrolase [Gemmataceae bacterium]|nr:bifunctional phosphoribosylaminoimidazolecarboxamide formyltransferase/IMP cyclohydrolase [Gemmata sp.]MDW8198818.1 bifunctional phosphoribosylaminoimidazolecarboxamide formyltransferase/IMP cyclohydrolase [Gemmataceae bacterium]